LGLSKKNTSLVAKSKKMQIPLHLKNEIWKTISCFCGSFCHLFDPNFIPVKSKPNRKPEEQAENNLKLSKKSTKLSKQCHP